MAKHRYPTPFIRGALASAFGLLGGCYIVGVNEPARDGYARVIVPKLPDGVAAVVVLAVRSKHHFVEQAIPSEQSKGAASFSLRPGTHVLEIECYRPNAVAVLHGGMTFEVTVKAGQSYVLDCEPAKAEGYDYFDNNFSLTRT